MWLWISIGFLTGTVYGVLVTLGAVRASGPRPPSPPSVPALPPATARAFRITRKRLLADIRPALARTSFDHETTR
jgi:hypothetical protein